jgi:cell wall assembly regulator SMI1
MRMNLLVAVLTFFTTIIAIAVKGQGGSESAGTPVVRELNRLDAWMKTNAPGIEQGLHPPLQRSQIEALATQRLVRVSEEVYSLYAWHDGAGAGTTLFGEYRFLPAAEAFAYGDAMHKADPSAPYKLPLFRSSVHSAVYTSDSLSGRVEFTYTGSSVQTETLTSFLSALAQSFEKGGSEFSSAVFERALLDVRPLRSKAVDQVLAGGADQLKPAEEMAAYGDLLAIQHPQSEKFIIAAADRWSEDENYSFSTMELLARLDTGAAWDTMQKLMRSPHPAARLRAYAMVAFWWHNDGRKLDAVTEDVAIQDLASDTFNNLDRRLVARALRRAPDTWVPAVLTALTNPEKDTRIAAAETLGILGDEHASTALFAQATKDSDEDVRAACYHALADLGNTEGEQQLLAQLSMSDPLTLDHALKAGSPAAERFARQVLEGRRSQRKL